MPRTVTEDAAPETTRKERPAPQDQADGSAESLHKVEPSATEDEHIGATEDQVSDTTAPAGSAFKDEPKQG